MGWRFRRSFKIAPGVRWNIGTRGSSWSVGPRGFKVNVSKRGIRRTVSIPGTGISHSKMLSSPDRPVPSPLPFASPSPTAVAASSRIRVHGPLTDQAAAEAVASWARGEFPILGRMLPSVVTDVQRHAVQRTDVSYTIARRRVSVRTEPLPRKVKAQGAAPDPAAYDPWAETIDEVLRQTEVIAVCPACEGEGSRRCPQCDGAIEFTCDVCGGDGQNISERSGKLIKCRSCGGDGLRKCPCRDGFVQCAGCAGKGVAKTWLAVEGEQRLVQCGSGDAPFRHADLAGASADNVNTTLSWEGLPEGAPPAIRDAISQCSLNAGTIEPNDRVTGVRVERRASEIAVVSYELAGQVGAVTIPAWTGELQPETSALEPLRIVKRRLRIVSVLGLLGSLTLLGWFVSRHAYYAESSAAANLGLLAVLVPLALLPPTAHLARPRRTQSFLRLVAYSVPAMFFFTMQVVQASTQPSVERARALQASGQLDTARKEARAAVEVGNDVEPAKSVHDQIQLQLLKTNTDQAILWPALERAHFFTNSARQLGQDHALDRLGQMTGALLENGDYRRTLVVLAGVPAAFRESPIVRVRFVSAHRQSAEAAAAIITSKEPFTQRLAACVQVQQPISELAKTPEPFTGRASIERLCAALSTEQLRLTRLAEQAARTERLRTERAAKAAALRAQAASRARDSVPLLCRDGTLSPSCICGGSRRGCCSHHGGVAGCSQ